MDGFTMQEKTYLERKANAKKSPAQKARVQEKRSCKPRTEADRSLSGGVLRIRPTEAELQAKMEGIYAVNASIIERHRREEADRAAHKAREEALRQYLEEQDKARREKALVEEHENFLREKREKFLRDKQMKSSRGKKFQGQRPWSKDSKKVIDEKKPDTSGYVVFEPKARQPGEEPEASVKIPISVLNLLKPKPKPKKLDWAEEMDELEELEKSKIN
ncbi:hypothetical protein K3495_g11174 [Podosphaera aphanis]|nr:hypothetical protein K3495_g11174 [Podosphaera aphanis]